jgi:hypothetical protein
VKLGEVDLDLTLRAKKPCRSRLRHQLSVLPSSEIVVAIAGEYNSGPYPYGKA